MIELKVRAWLKKAIPQGMVNVEAIDFEKREITVLMGVYGLTVHSFEDVILMLYTGLKDKNDKKIYEGDIIKINFSRLYIVKFGEYITYDSVGGIYYRGNGFYKEYKYEDVVEGETKKKEFLQFRHH